MNAGWSWYIAVFTVANILGCLWLLWWTGRKRPDLKPEDPTTGHRWDGDLTEYNKPLPRWWLNLFYLTIAFGLGYLVIYPGLGAFGGTRGWSSEREHAADIAAANAKLERALARFRGQPLAVLAGDSAATEFGRSVFANHCATCHGSDARGARGFPNLTDGDWLWGGGPDTILATISDGRQGMMPGFGAALGEEGVTATAAYVQSLGGARVDATLAAAGERHFQTICVACHGSDGTGNPLLGAPNLTDGAWLYGGDPATIAETIRNGRSGQMPAHRDLIGEDRVRLAAAWVIRQGRGAEPPTDRVP